MMRSSSTTHADTKKLRLMPIPQGDTLPVFPTIIGYPNRNTGLG